MTYEYRIGTSGSWVDLNGIVDSRKTEIREHLCTTGFMSAVDEATFSIPSSNLTGKQSLVDAIMGDTDVYVRISNGSTTLFTGLIDRSSTSVSSTKISGEVTVNCRDMSTLKLDDKVSTNVFLENQSITYIVKHLLTLAGYTYTASSITSSEERVLRAFVIDKDDSETYRNYIDRLLFEAGGYVLNFNASGVAEIVRLPWDDLQTARDVDNYHLATGLSTTGKILDADGVKVTWSLLNEKENATVYQADLGLTESEGTVIGQRIYNNDYWPSDLDHESGGVNAPTSPTYMEFNNMLLDTPYLTKQTRSQNKDLSIICVRNVTANIVAKKDGVDWNAFSHPVSGPASDPNYDVNIASLGLYTNPTIYPTKAWFCLKNASGSDNVYLNLFDLKGDVVYRQKTIEYQSPSTSKKPEEYTSEYIYSVAHATHFTNFYWHFLNHSRFESTWAEINGGTLGETVNIVHKDASSGQHAVVVTKKTVFLNETTRKVSMTAIGISTYSAYAISKNTVVSGEKQKGEKGDKGEPGSTGWSQATVTLYKRSQTAPVYDGGVLTYTFSTGGVTGDLGTWNRSVPSGSEPLYVISASAFANSATDTIPVNEWTTPAILSENGTKGDDGYTVMTIILYQRGASAPARPTQTATYNFENRTISGVSPWTLDIPSGTDPIWVTVATASTRLSTLATDNIEPDEWAVVQKFVENGADGNGIQSISYFYKATTTQTAPSAGSITSTSIPTLSETDKYLWQKEVIDYTDEPDKTTVALIGVYGNTGDPGRGISSVTNYYKTSNSKTTAPTSGWVTTLQVPDETNPYLWNYESIAYTSGSPTDTTPQVISQWIKGKSVSSITEYYKTNNSRTTAPTTGWVTTLQVPDETNPYLWNKEVISYSEGSDTESTPQIISQWIKGDPGTNGKNVIKFGSRSWTQAQINTICVAGYTATWTNADGVAVNSGDTVYFVVTNRTTGKSGMLYMKANGSCTTSTALNTTVVQYLKDGTDGDDGAYLNANASNLLIRDGEKSVLSTQASGTVTTKITANGSSVDYMKGISTITPFHLGKKRIRLVNLLKNVTSSSYRGMYATWYGELDRIDLQTDNPFSVGDKVYYRNYLNNPNSVSNNVYTRWQVFRSGSDRTGGVGNAINMGTSGLSSLLIPLTANYYSYNLLQFLINCDDGTENTIEYKESLAINLTESGLIDYLALIGVTTDAQIKTWCDTYIPYFTGTFDIGGYVENLAVTVDSTCTSSSGSSYTLWSQSVPRPLDYEYRYWRSVFNVSGTFTNTPTISFPWIDGTGAWRGGKTVTKGVDVENSVLWPFTTFNNQTNYAVIASPSSGTWNGNVTLHTFNHFALNILQQGIQAFLSLLGITTDSDKKNWLDAYLPFFSGTESMYNLLPSSVDVTFTSTDSLTQKVTVQYYAQKSDMGIGVTTPSNTVLRVFGVNPDTGEQMGTSFFRRNGSLETVNTQSTVSGVTSDYTDFTFGASCTGGKYAIALYRPSNFYRPIVLEIHPDSNGTTAQILWRDLSGSTTDASGNTYSSTALIVGQFEYSGSQIIPDTIDMFASARELTGYLNGSFMEILGASTGNDPTLNVLAKAMGVERVFEKIAVLEAFVNHLFANTIEIANNGVIQSLDYDNTQSDKKFRIQSDGTADFYKASLHDVEISGSSTFNGTGEFNGKLKNTVFETFESASSASSKSVTSTLWYGQDIYTVLSQNNDIVDKDYLMQESNLGTINGVSVDAVSLGSGFQTNRIYPTVAGTTWTVRTNSSIYLYAFSGDVTINGVSKATGLYSVTSGDVIVFTRVGVRAYFASKQSWIFHNNSADNWDLWIIDANTYYSQSSVPCVDVNSYESSKGLYVVNKFTSSTCLYRLAGANDIPDIPSGSTCTATGTVNLYHGDAVYQYTVNSISKTNPNSIVINGTNQSLGSRTFSETVGNYVDFDFNITISINEKYVGVYSLRPLNDASVNIGESTHKFNYGYFNNCYGAVFN